MKCLEGVCALGIENKLNNGKYLLFLDYDKINMNSVEEDINKIYRENNLTGNIYLFKSEGGYHIYNFDLEFDFDELNELLHKTKADVNFIKCLKWNGENTLRLSPKKDGIKYIKTIFFNKPESISKEGQEIKRIVFEMVDYYGKN